jgi:hypothetical protein
VSRSARTDSTVGVSCGHRVPRVPVKLDGTAGHRYWCDECGTHRMSGGRSSGEHAFDFLLELRDTVVSIGLSVDDPGTERGRATIRALGAHVRS